MMSLFKNFSRLLLVFYVIGIFFLCSTILATEDEEVIDTPSVGGLSVEVVSNNVVISWPSTARESFVALCRSNATHQAPWVVLTNQMHASATGNQTAFLDIGGLDRVHVNAAKTNLARLYAVHVIPDFWFPMHDVILSGGPTIPSEDFLPFYYGKAPNTCIQSIGLMVDGEEAGWGPIHVERINFGTLENPRWIFVTGFWFRHDALADGEHTLQLRSMISLNNFIGASSQDIFLTNKPVRVKISSKASSNCWWDQCLGHDFNVPRTPEAYGEKFLRDGTAPPNVQVPFRPLSLHETTTETAFSLQLGSTQKFVQVTADYSNAVLEVLLPYFSDFAQKLNLPVPHSFTKSDITDCRILPWLDEHGGIAGASIRTKSGLSFYFQSGYVSGFSRSKAYHSLQNPGEIPKYFGKVKLTKEQAIQLARNTINKLGISLEDVFAEQEPRVTLPEKIGTNTVARYFVEWANPRGNGPGTVRMEINGEMGQLESLLFHARNLEKASPRANVNPPSAHGKFDSKIPPPVNPEYARQLIPIMFKAIDEYAEKLSLPIPRPLTSNNVVRVEIHNNEGWPHAEIAVANGWRFIYRHAMVNGCYGPDNFFDSDRRKIHIKEFEGKWNLTTNQAIEVVRQALKKLNYPTNNIHMDFTPKVYTATVDKGHIPRLRFEWHHSVHDELQSKVEAEVNVDNGKLESLYYDDMAYWGGRPPIKIPISIKEPRSAPITKKSPSAHVNNPLVTNIWHHPPIAGPPSTNQ